MYYCSSISFLMVLLVSIFIFYIIHSLGLYFFVLLWGSWYIGLLLFSFLSNYIRSYLLLLVCYKYIFVILFTGTCCKKIPFRIWIAVMVFLTTYVNYTTRVNMSISIVSMTGGKKTREPVCLARNRTESEVLTTTTPKPLPDVGILFFITT